jgi:hypothetical protein
MLRFIISTLVSLAWAIPASAQDSSHDQFAAPTAAQSRAALVTEAMRSIQRDIRLDLALAGFTDIQIVPTSFMISAKDHDGHSVTMMTPPSSIAELSEVGKACEPDGGSSVMPSADM